MTFGIDTNDTHLRASIAFELASYVVFVYDFLLTFGDEVERIWTGPFTGATALFLLNRYGTFIIYGIDTLAFNTDWSDDSCVPLSQFEGAGTMVITAVCELVMILRVYALYRGNVWMLTGLLVILAAQIAVMSAAVTHGKRLPLSDRQIGPCILTGQGKFFGAYWIAPLVTDTSVFLSTLWKTRGYFTRKERFRTPIMRIFINDGILYFAVIVSANLMNVMFYYMASEDLRTICASFSLLITSVMISRLVLNLRSFRVAQQEVVAEPMLRMVSRRRTREDVFSRTWVAKRIIGNLGQEIEDVPWAPKPDTQRGDIELRPIR